MTILYCQGFRHLVGVVFYQNSQNARKVALNEKLPASFTKVEVSPVLAGLISNLINLMNATNLTKQNFLIGFRLSQTYHRTWGITLRQILLRDFWLCIFFSGRADYKYYQKKISYSPYVTCITTPPSTKPPPLFEQQCGIF